MYRISSSVPRFTILIKLTLLTVLLVLPAAPLPAQIVINEIMQDPAAVSDTNGEWFELHNPTASPIDIEGWTIEDNDTDSHLIANGGPFVIPAGGFVVLARNGNAGTNGGVTADYIYAGITLANSADELVLLDSGLSEVDRVEWDGGVTFPAPTGASMEVALDRLGENHLGANWCEGSTPFGAGDLGTPGAANACCQGLSCYYDTVDVNDLTSTRQTLHATVDDHVRTAFSSAASWQILELADEDPNDSSRILDIYRNASYAKVGDGSGPYNREHSWPDSYGFPVDSGTGMYPRSDYHALFLADSGYNSSRSNLPFDTCSAACAELTTEANNGQGGAGGPYPGESNWRTGSGPTGTWETWAGVNGGRRGDVARALFYMDVRYDGSDHLDASEEPDLILTSNRALLTADNTNNQDPAYMGILSTLLQWHEEDPPDAVEMWRNEAVYEFQRNRNPFIDHPEWVRCVYISPCGFFADGFESGNTSAWSVTVP